MNKLQVVLIIIFLSTLSFAQKSTPPYNNIGEFGEYKTSWALVEKDGLKGFINEEGEEVVKPQYDNIGEFGKYKTSWALVEKDGLKGFINEKGEKVVKPQYDNIGKDKE